MKDKLIEFIRKRDYRLIKELGQGACGKTVLLHDDMINEYFVCKKYSPFSDEYQQELFTNFIREIKLLHQVYHQNVVCVFNYYLYPDKLTGYILMEFVDGADIEEYLDKAPEKTNEIFIQSINGFRYLETNNILHRDIRPQNLMISREGVVKIIDLGFGKRVQYPEDFDKSISLNWWCEPPEEFKESTYDFRTEVYFVGKLFEKIIQEKGIDHFEYKGILSRMCHRNPESRVQNFFDIEKEIQSNIFFQIGFSDYEIEFYRQFADCLTRNIPKIENGAKYVQDFDRVQIQLEDAYRSFMLEETVPDSTLVIRCFLNGPYYYKKTGFTVEPVKDFLHLLKTSSQEKMRIIMANLHTRLDAIMRYSDKEINYDDIPF